MAQYKSVELDGRLPSKRWLSCYDTIADPEEFPPEYWSHDWDELLRRRSAYEFIRDQLTPEQQADLDRIDAFWRAHPQAFNQAFVNEHHRANHQTELEGYVQDQHGNTPAIPKSHWWWRPLATSKQQ